MDKFRNKYRIQSHRMPHWDYAGNGIYFITFVTKNRECILGEIYDKKMILTDFGKIVDEQWHKSFQIRNELFLDEYIIMPNHLHAIVVLENITTHIERGSKPLSAAIYATNEVSVSIIASTLVIFSVFIPLTMTSGMAGILFGQLGWIITVVIFVSMAASLTLTPPLVIIPSEISPSDLNPNVMFSIRIIE